MEGETRADEPRVCLSTVLSPRSYILRWEPSFRVVQTPGHTSSPPTRVLTYGSFLVGK